MDRHRCLTTGTPVSKTASIEPDWSSANRLVAVPCESGAGARARSSTLVPPSSASKLRKTTNLRRDDDPLLERPDALPVPAAFAPDDRPDWDRRPLLMLRDEVAF